ncbi:MAG: hypothetical protein COU71_02855 [Parcubacteria group bacterium CG10_big_fil_rev_8_21_14_0_10_38_31]|nr:MAG: hypothetical protein COU71_02855 [Parcubacteria group bacterium CG10_big_fil_rev_8_21_14_0_10_38_31]
MVNILSLKNIIRFIGIFIFIFILFKVNARESLYIIKGSNIFLIILALLVGTLPIFLRNLRWQKLLKSEGIIINFLETLLVYFNAIFWGSITPGKIGEFSKIIYLTKRGSPWGKATASVIFDRLFDITTIIILGALGVFIFFGGLKKLTHIFLIMSVILLAFILTMYFNKNFIKKILKKIIKKVSTRKNHNITEEEVDNLFNSFNKPTLILLSGTMISIFAWILYFLQIYILAKSIGIEITFILTSAIIAIITALNLIPITISGIGTRDVALILLFSQIGIRKEEALSFSLMILLTFVVGGLLGWICGFFLKKHPFQVGESSISQNS